MASLSTTAASADRVHAITASFQAANDSAPLPAPERTRIVTIPAGATAAPGSPIPIDSRARGLGQSFRTPASSARFTEKQP
jgi:hypothetical protein